MRKLLFAFTYCFLTLSGIAYAQTTLSVSPNYIQGHPDSIYYNDTLQYTVYIKNTGSAVFNGDIIVSAGVDNGGSITTVANDSTLTLITNMAPNDSLPVTLNFPCKDSIGFGIGINTVVIWPATDIPGTQYGDSLRDSVYVIGFVGLPPSDPWYDRCGNISVNPNPAYTYSWLGMDHTCTPTYLRIRDLFGRLVKELDINERQFYVDDLPSGIYLIEAGWPSGHRTTLKLLKH
ncbi:MAG: T9SS type A sorting domain-containing protein [Flavobacteriales bacterium]|nr:T9SS type A sorting domain-containing protein [Flavobacteriales bacterium]